MPVYPNHSKEMTDQKIIRFLITGGSGFVGWNLCNFLKSRHEVCASYCEHPFQIEGCRFLQIDLTRKSPVLEAIGSCKPEIIIHAAAISSPDVCEQQKERAWEVNVTGTQNILDAASQYKCRVVYISTDLVFDGERGNYSETDTPTPVNYYGLTKREGEKLCLQSPSDALVVRITLQYGWGNGDHPSFLDWLMTNLQSGKQVSLFTDQYRTMTCVLDTARGLEIAALNGTAKEIYHLTSPERVSRYEFGRLFASAFNLPQSLLKKSLMEEVPAAARRPKDVSLNGEKFLRQFNYQPRSIRDGLKAMAEE
jgi:dTDP-4-dehydrorhamnose reductase